MNSHPWGRDLVTALLAMWVTAGEYLDGWSHIHGYTDNTFFTIWHGMLYTGLLFFGIWLGIVAYPAARRLRRSGQSLRNLPREVPTGYRAALYGYGIFIVGAPLDVVWHTTLGFEKSVEALMSPPHLLILFGWLTMVSTAWRSQRAISARATVPEIISLASVVSLAAFFVAYKFPYRAARLLSPYEGDDMAANWISTLLVGTLVLMIPVLWQLRDNRYRVGLLTLTVAMVSLGGSLAISQNWGIPVLLTGAAFSTLGALIADIMLARLRPMWSNWRYGLPIMMAETAFLVWGGLYLGDVLHGSITWPVTVWAGSLLMACGAAAGMGAILWRAPVAPERAKASGGTVAFEPNNPVGQPAHHLDNNVPARLSAGA